MSELLNPGILNLASLAVSVALLLVGLLLWFFVNRASSRANEQIELLRALLEPTAQLRQLENDGDYTARLALLEEQKSLPWQAIWEMYCQRHDTPAGSQWLDSVRAYENAVLSQRG